MYIYIKTGIKSRFLGFIGVDFMINAQLIQPGKENLGTFSFFIFQLLYLTFRFVRQG